MTTVADDPVVAHPMTSYKDVTRTCSLSPLDHVFDELRSALLKYNFNATKYYHSPVVKDKEIMKDMRYRTAILYYSICAFFYTMIGKSSEISFHKK